MMRDLKIILCGMLLWPFVALPCAWLGVADGPKIAICAIVAVGYTFSALIEVKA